MKNYTFEELDKEIKISNNNKNGTEFILCLKSPNDMIEFKIMSSFNFENIDDALDYKNRNHIKITKLQFGSAVVYSTHKFTDKFTECRNENFPNQVLYCNEIENKIKPLQEKLASISEKNTTDLFVYLVDEYNSILKEYYKSEVNNINSVEKRMSQLIIIEEDF